jgi:hypothetical protein
MLRFEAILVPFFAGCPDVDIAQQTAEKVRCLSFVAR